MFKVVIIAICILSFYSAHSQDIKTNQMILDFVEHADIKSKIIVDVRKEGALIDKNFYGAHLSSYTEIPEKKYLDELKVGMIRIGGNEYDVFNWKNKLSLTKFGGVKGIHGFEEIEKILKSYNLSGIYQVNLMGFQPEKVGETYILKKTFNAYSAYELIKFLNGAEKLNIVNFSLGNEFSQWHETHSHIWPTSDGISADEYIDRFIEFALAMRKAQDEVSGNPNDIKIWGPEISTSWLDWNTGNFTKDCEWSNVRGQVSCHYGGGKFDHFIPYFFYRISQAEKDKKINPNRYKILDYYSFHYYPNFRKIVSDLSSIATDGGGKQQVREILDSTGVLNNPRFVNTIDLSSYKNFAPDILGRTKQWIHDFYPKVKIAANEFALDSDYRTNNYHPIIRPLYLADSLGIMIREGVSFFNHFILSSGKGADEIWSLLKNSSERTNLFYTYKIFSNHFLGASIPTEGIQLYGANSYATIQGELIHLALINKRPLDQKVQVYIKNFKGSNKVITYTMPPWSVSILEFNKRPRKSDQLTSYHYGALEMGIPVEVSYDK